ARWAASELNVPNRARPIIMDSSRVVGVTAGDGQIAMPLDAELGFDRESCGSLPRIHEPRDSVQRAAASSRPIRWTCRPASRENAGDIGTALLGARCSGIQGASGWRVPPHTTRKPRVWYRSWGGYLSR